MIRRQQQFRARVDGSLLAGGGLSATDGSLFWFPSSSSSRDDYNAVGGKLGVLFGGRGTTTVVVGRRTAVSGRSILIGTFAAAVRSSSDTVERHYVVTHVCVFYNY